MANVTFNDATIRPRGDTASNWSSANPILAKNEVGYDETNKKFKIGDGVTPWNSLPYANVAPSNSGVYYVEGTGTTEGIWTGSSSDITSYYDGLIVAYKLNIAGASTTTLNINGLGAKTVYLRGDTKLTTHYAVNTVILAVYTTVSGVGRWYVNDYDANSYAYVRQYKTTTSADYPMLLAYETTLPSSYDTKYTRKNSTITANPSTGTIKATKFDGTATKAIADENGNNIASTYALKSEIPEGSTVNLEPIKISGSYDWENYENTLEFTEENYQQFLKNKTAPVVIDDEIYNLSYIGSEDGNEYYYYYKRITEEKIYTLSIGWNPIDYGYSDEQIVDEISSSVSGKAVLSYTMSSGDVIQLSEDAKTTINKYGVENIIFKINDGSGSTYYLELSALTDDPLYSYEYLDANNDYYCIDLETDFSSITFTFLESQLGNNLPYYDPIEIGGTITVDDGENFVIQNPSITVDKYPQFLQNKNAPIKIGTQVFQLEDLSSSSNSYNATYTLLKYFYAFGDYHLYKIHITIVWAAGEGNSFLAQTFLRKENVVQDEPIILPGNDTGFSTDDWSLTNVGVSQNNYQQFLKNKLSPVQIGDNMYQLNYLVPIAEGDYAAGYYLVSGKFTHCFFIRWQDENSSIATYSTSQYAGYTELLNAINLVNGRIDNTNEDVEILNAKTQELYDKVFSGIANDPARIYNLFYVDSSQTYYVRVNRALEEGGYIKLGQDPSDTSLSYYVYRPASTDNYWFSAGNYNDTMSRMTLVDEANSVYSFTIMSVLNGNKIQPSAEEETTLAYFVDIDAIGETPETETSGTGLNIYPLPGYLNFDNPTLSVTNSQVVEIKNANAISCTAEVSGLGQCGVILYICSNTANYICFTDAMFIIEGQKFYVRRAYIDCATLTLNFTPDA